MTTYDVTIAAGMARRARLLAKNAVGAVINGVTYSLTTTGAVAATIDYQSDVTWATLVVIATGDGQNSGSVTIVETKSGTSTTINVAVTPSVTEIVVEFESDEIPMGTADVVVAPDSVDPNLPMGAA